MQGTYKNRFKKRQRQKDCLSFCTRKFEEMKNIKKIIEMNMRTLDIVLVFEFADKLGGSLAIKLAEHRDALNRIINQNSSQIYQFFDAYVYGKR